MKIYEKAREFGLKHIEPYAADIDKNARFPKETFEALGKEGFLKMMVPKEYGGDGLTMQEHAEACMGFAEYCASAGLCYMMHNVCLMVVLNHGSEELKKEVCEAIVNNNEFCALAYSEFGTGTHFYIPELKAEYRDGYTVISGRKSMVTSAEQASYYLISAPSQKEGVTDNWLVPLKKEGVSFEMNEWNGVGMKGNVSCPMTLTNVKLEDKYMVGEPGTAIDQIFGTVAPFFIVGLASVYSGLSLAMYEAARKHAIDRVYPNGQGLIHIETVQIHLANLYNRSHAAKYFTFEAARAAANGEEDALPKILSARINASEGAIECAKWAMRIGGGKAYNGNGPLERYMRDSYAGQIMAPSVDVLITWLGKAVTGQDLI